MEIASIIAAAASLLISGFIFRDNYLRKGKIRMTHPTMIAFAFDGIKGPSKVFIRTLLFNTSKKGQVVETLFLKLKNQQSDQVFNVWGYGENDLVRGSGLYVPPNGVVHNHHFLTPKARGHYVFTEGKYIIEFYALPFGKKKPSKLKEISLKLNRESSMQLAHRTTSVIFDWNPETNQYEAHQEELTSEMITQLLS